MNAQSVLGKWKVRDEKTGEANAIVEIYKKKELVFAKIVEILDPNYIDKKCTLCKGKNKDKPGVGINVLINLKSKNKKWSDGYAFDPRNGNYYNCYIKLVNSNKLKVRGFVGIPIIGRTIYWERLQ